MPRMPLRGVRISWDTMARNRPLARFAASASRHSHSRSAKFSIRASSAALRRRRLRLSGRITMTPAAAISGTPNARHRLEVARRAVGVGRRIGREPGERHQRDPQYGVHGRAQARPPRGRARGRNSDPIRFRRRRHGPRFDGLLAVSSTDGPAARLYRRGCHGGHGIRQRGVVDVDACGREPCHGHHVMTHRPNATRLVGHVARRSQEPPDDGVLVNLILLGDQDRAVSEGSKRRSRPCEGSIFRMPPARRLAARGDGGGIISPLALAISPSRRPPGLVRQRPIGQRLGEMYPAHRLLGVEVGERAGDAQHAVIAARGEPHGFRGLAQQAARRCRAWRSSPGPSRSPARWCAPRGRARHSARPGWCGRGRRGRGPRLILRSAADGSGRRR